MKDTENYRRGFDIWKKWFLQFHEVDLFPAKDVFVALCITSMIQESESFNKIKQVYYSLKFVHDVYGFKNPCKSSLMKLVLDSAGRKLSKPVQKKEVIKLRHLRDMMTMLTKHGKQNFFNIRTLRMCLISHAGFLRFNELVNIKRSDIFLEKRILNCSLRKVKQTYIEMARGSL